MKTTVWAKKKVTVYIGGDPAKNQAPEITIEMENPQFQFDTDKNTIIIFETR
jgi:hypothetical protein